ncbi:MAG: nucleoside recognition domain-containing protein [Dethiobacteria bacterium]|nr:nucleoside recognition domain-containing protein [Bacillota bacterium]HOB28388.1 nucleoside recognition domain-containing protein [Bacillota bacterium]HPZ41234.1 nucleoside recognition domain-containing protein [Bacillota bacterium]HQD51937.1 nucleoside recognition domain-containing protein [Bacillota bacterium]
MIGYLWAALICLSILTAAIRGDMAVITPAIFTAAERGVKVAFGLIGTMTFWLGIMKLIESSGIIKLLNWALRPLARLIFPRVPEGGPAMNAILMNLSANILGLGNAATPFGIKAMEEMQKINPYGTTASDEMCTFLALNTSSITLIPTTVMALRAAAGAANPADILGSTILATFCSTAVALTADRLLRKKVKI